MTYREAPPLCPPACPGIPQECPQVCPRHAPRIRPPLPGGMGRYIKGVTRQCVGLFAIVLGQKLLRYSAGKFRDGYQSLAEVTALICRKDLQLFIAVGWDVLRRM